MGERMVRRIPGPRSPFERRSPELFVGVDLGQAQDFTAIAVLEGGDIYRVRHLMRERGVPYPKIINQIQSLLYSRELETSATTLIVDQTGVGAPVVDLLRSRGLVLKAITITGGDRAHADDNDKWKRNWRVPKRDLISNLVVLSQSHRLKIAAGLKEADTLANELQNMRVKIDLRTAHDSYTTWREGQHDDLVLAVALAAWWAENRSLPKPSYPFLLSG
jgi:hypothetical protein